MGFKNVANQPRKFNIRLVNIDVSRPLAIKKYVFTSLTYTYYFNEKIYGVAHKNVFSIEPYLQRIKKLNLMQYCKTLLSFGSLTNILRSLLYPRFAVKLKLNL